MKTRLLKRLRLKIILSLFTILATLLIIGITALVLMLNQRMTTTLAQKTLLRPTELYAQGMSFSTRDPWRSEFFEKHLRQLSYRSRDAGQVLLAGDYFFGPAPDCAARLPRDLPDETKGCLVIVPRDTPPGRESSRQIWIFHNGIDAINEVAIGAEGLPADVVSLEPRRFAQYIGAEPLMQENVSLSNVPSLCLHAILSIEDQNFLEHAGFSLTALGRAVVRNVSEGRKAQGGSTITQQLVKNYFLTSEKSYERKLKELILAILLETRFSKDEILETYLNVIYMGQFGAFRVHGYASASKYYFSRPLEQLSLHECALLAALVNNPGGLNPWRRPEAAVRRRALVLRKMKERELISEAEESAAAAAPLPPMAPVILATDTAPYFIDAVRKQVAELGLPFEGLRIETSLDLDIQQMAQDAVQKTLERLEGNNPHLKKLKGQGRQLESALLSADPATGLIQAVVGGRSFRKTQFNRAVDSRRQVGSVMKPLVYLAALTSENEEGELHGPLTPLRDEKTVFRYEGQQWSPENYDRRFRGEVPLYAGLKDSLNAATAALGMAVGLDRIIDLARAFGVRSELKPVPSLTLGSFEMSPREVLGVALGLAGMGELPTSSFIRRITTDEGKIVFEHSPSKRTIVEPAAVAELVGIMKTAFSSGTAVGAKSWGFNLPAAGKTGTTSGERDSWFMGFTPHRATVVWVGFDDGTATRLTGASGALPVWATFMTEASKGRAAEDFVWPPDTTVRTLERAPLEGQDSVKPGQPETIDLVFRDESAR